MNTIHDIDLAAKSFLGFVLKEGNRLEKREIQRITLTEFNTLLDVVRLAGFGDARRLIPRKPVQNSSIYHAKSMCPGKLVDEHGEEYYQATGWLDEMIRRVWDAHLHRISSTTTDEILKWIVSEIRRSRPLEPIQLTHDGHFLCELSPGERGQKGFLIDHSRDDHPTGAHIGIHQYCGGIISRRPATKECDSFVCAKCPMYGIFPKKLSRYGDFRDFFTKRVHAVQEEQRTFGNVLSK